MVATAALSLAVPGCGESRTGAESPSGRAPEPTTTASTAPRTVQRTNDALGFTVAYPAGWNTNAGEVAPGCSFFDPDALSVEAGTEPDAAISFVASRRSFEQAASADAFDEVRSRQEDFVDGRRAVAVLDRRSGSGAARPGALAYVWIVERRDGSLIAVTRQSGERDFDRAGQVLDAMVQSLRLPDRSLRRLSRVDVSQDRRMGVRPCAIDLSVGRLRSVRPRRARAGRALGPGAPHSPRSR